MWKENGGSRIVYRQLAGEQGKIVISNAAVELKGANESHL
jgi:hypothetical protein